MKRVISLILLLLALAFTFDVRAQAPGIIQSNTLQLKEEGSSIGRVKSIDCVGAGITCTASGINGTMTISGGSGYNTIQDEGSGLTQRTTLDFTGAGVSCSDTGVKTQCTISSGGGSGLTHPEVMSRVSLGF